MAGETLRVSGGNASGRAIAVEGEVVIGRAEAETLGEDTEISRRHARLARSPDGGLTIEDLGSTNGTFVNGTRIGAPHALSPGDTIQVGGTTLVVEGAPTPAGAAPVAPPPRPPPPAPPAAAPAGPPLAAPPVAAAGAAPARGDAGGGAAVLAVILGIVALAGALFMAGFNYVGATETPCEDIDFSDFDFGDDCLDISSTGLWVARIAGWPAMVLAFLVLPFAIRFAVQRRNARQWVLPLVAALVLAGIAIGGAQLL